MITTSNEASITSSSITGFYPSYQVQETPSYSWTTYQEPTMEATITFKSIGSLTKEQFRAKVEKIVRKLENKYNVTDINIEF